MKYCAKCGAKLQDDDVFCPKCGARSRAVAPASTAPTVRRSGAPAASNAKLLLDYLSGAKELEWDHYTLDRIGAQLNEKLNAATKRKAQLEADLPRLEKESATLAGNIDNYRRSDFSASKPKVKLGFEWGGFLATFFICDLIFVATYIAGASFSNPTLRAVAVFYSTKMQALGIIPSLILVMLVVPLIVYLGLLFLGKLMREGRQAAANRKAAAQHELRERKVEADKKQEWRLQIDRNDDRLAKLRAELAGLNAATIPQLNAELHQNRQALAASEASLQRYYSANVLYPKYRALVPVLAMWEYLDSGRCGELTGHGGAYDVYESEVRLNAINAKLDSLSQQISKLSRDMSAQLSRVNGQISGLISSVDDANRQNLRALKQIESGTARLQASVQMQSYYQAATARSAEHIDRMVSARYYDKHLM